MANNCWQDSKNVKNIIDVGSSVNSNTGDFVRVGFIKTQKNFEQLEDTIDRLENCDCLANTLATFIPPVEYELLQKTYEITPNTTTLDLSFATTVQYNVVTSNVSDGQVLLWKNIGNTISSQFTDNLNEGSVTIVSNQGTIERSVVSENISDDKNIILQLRRGSFFSPVVATADVVNIFPNFLRLYMDATQSASYPGSGSTWFDLEPLLQYYNGTINGAIYDNFGGISNFYFDGSNDVVTTNPSPNTTISNNLTIEMWLSPESTHEIDVESTTGNTGASGQKYVIYPANTNSTNNADLAISVGTNGISVYEYSNVPSSTIFTTATIVSTPSAPRIAGGGAYSGGLLNQAGIWETNINATGFSRTYQVNFPHTGNYIIMGSCDDLGNVYIDGTKVLFIQGFNAVHTNTVIVQSGTRTLTLEGWNIPGTPGGLATIIEFAGGVHMPALLAHSNTISNVNYTHAVVTLENKQPKLYLNGNLVATGLTSTKSNVYAQVRSIGGGTFGYYNGKLSLLKVYKSALSNTKILQKYNESKNNYNIDLNFNQIITQNLVFNLDGSNTSSYSGSGSIWYDLSPSGKTGTITGATYDSANANGFLFDGNDYVGVSSTFFPTLVNNFTLEVWCRPSSTITVHGQSTTGITGVFGTNRYVIREDYVDYPNCGIGLSVGTNGLCVSEHSGSHLPITLSYSTSITKMTHIIIKYINKQGNLYIDGNFIKSGLTSVMSNVYLPGTRIGAGTYGAFIGKIGAVRFYNGLLSDSQIRNNYYSGKNKFIV